MFALGLTAVLVCLVGLGVALGYTVGYGHGHDEAKSEGWEQLQRQQRRYKRCTPEPTRLRLMDPRHPVFFDQDGPTPA